MTTGENIGRLAQEKGISLHKLSDKADVPYTTLYSIVKRKSDKIDVETLKKIALALDLHPIEIMGNSSADMVLYGMELLERATSGTSNWKPVSFEQLHTEQQTYLENRMHKAFSALNEDGQVEACKRVEQMADTKEYRLITTTPSPDESPDKKDVDPT